MTRIAYENQDFTTFTDLAESMADSLEGHGPDEELAGIRRLIANFNRKTEDFYRENRKLNIGVIGQVKAGKSSFLNTLLFDGKEILPKASTPKTATLTKLEYAEENTMEIEYYTADEWKELKDNAAVDLEDDIYTSAREIMAMVQQNGLDPAPCLEKGVERLAFASYDELLDCLNEYVGEDGKYTPLVKDVTLYLHRDEFKGLSIVDTPGLNDPIASRTLRTKEFMEVCDVVFFLSQSGSFLDGSDWILLSSQLPQKGVKKLVLVASKYDSGIRDVLKVPDEDDVFGDDGNTVDNIPQACKLIRRKLGKRARAKVKEFVQDLERRGSSPALIEVIQQCAEPVPVSALAYNMTHKDETEYSAEERNLFAALLPFSSDVKDELRLLGNFEEVRKIFDAAVKEKEAILAAKARDFVPNAREELKNLLTGYQEKAVKRAQILENNDREQLFAQKKLVEEQMGTIKSDLAVLFGELNAKLETEKSIRVRESRDISKDYLNIQERTGTRTVRKSYTVSDSKWYKPWTWGSSHVEYHTHEEHYLYCLAADAVENLKKYGLEATNRMEAVFSNTLQLKAFKRQLLDVVVKNFDLGSENFDASLVKLMVEETISKIEFPIFKLDMAQSIDAIAGQFSGELTDADQKTALTSALDKAVSRIFDELSDMLSRNVRQFKNEMADIEQQICSSLLNDTEKEFEALLEQCDRKEQEIAGYKEYAGLLDAALKKL